MDLGMKESEMKKVSDGMASVLADSYTLYLKTQNFHWNVTGPRFPELHKMFEGQYQEMAEAVDEIAERIRALGHRSPGTFKEFLELSSIKEEDQKLSADEMIYALVNGHEAVSRKAREVVGIADKFNDEASADLLSARIKTHEKTAWMLRSIVQ